MSTSKTTQIAQIQALIAGMPKYCATLSFTVAGTTYTAAQVVQIATSLIAADTATSTARVGYEEAEAAEEKLFATDGAVITAVRAALRTALSNSPASLADMLIAARKAPRPLTTEEKAARAAKVKATRLARGTTSKKQKATVTGNVTGVIITPVTAPAASAPATTPSATTPAAAPTGTTGGTSSHG